MEPIGTTVTRDELLLPNHHRRIERALDELRFQAGTDDPRALAEAWSDFEHELTAHLDAEERYILPAFAATHPEEAQVVRGEHDDLRRLVAELGVGVDLHCLRMPIADRLIERLRAHAHREDKLMYPWAVRHLQRWPDAVRARLGEPDHEHRSRRAELRTLLDEVRLKLHLAGMEARDAFHEISHEAEKLVRDPAHASREAVVRLAARLRAIAASIGSGD